MMIRNSLSLPITTNSMKDTTESITSTELMLPIKSTNGLGSISDSPEKTEKLSLTLDGKEKKNLPHTLMSNTSYQNTSV